MSYWLQMLSKHEQSVLSNIDTHIFDYFQNETSGHDYYHIKRVVDITSRLIALEDEARYLALLIAYFHDVFDDKVNPTDDLDSSLRELFKSWNLDFEGLESEIIAGVAQIGYKGGHGVVNKTYAAQYVSDADMIDSMGAIGIARTFYYAGSKGTPIYDPTLKGVTIESYDDYRNVQRNAIDHFDEKLLKLIDWIKTPEGKRMAQERHDLMQAFKDQFYKEMDI
ncbi:HD domain-containing protein [Erysipelothrix aquatica]|uniref:HD domain-containing protein n=2 Tax=Erysipelothrix aquatica TaxID=2683714 RepID=UPI001F27E511|nr:phosphohydrolase [Erysipelothrix aquatica]